ncbi:MAG: hypothetical protein QOE80_1562, partial [Actinomycetota bacterium]|nr:hypothetical protein [Actinomycetota bacterium]
MAAPRAPRRIALVAAATVLGALLVPTGVAHAATLTLQVSPEIQTADANNSATITPTVSAPVSSNTVIDIEIVDGPARKAGHVPGTPDTTCTVPQNGTACPAVTITSTEAGTSLVRAWIPGPGSPDMAEGRLASKRANPLLSSPADDCQSGLLSGGDGANCENGTAVPGDQAEPDATDVVQITFLNFTDGRLDCTDHRGGDVLYKNATTDPQAETYTC